MILKLFQLKSTVSKFNYTQINTKPKRNRLEIDYKFCPNDEKAVCCVKNADLQVPLWQAALPPPTTSVEPARCSPCSKTTTSTPPLLHWPRTATTSYLS